MAVDELRVGGRVLDRRAAFEHARHYLTDGSGWAYPSYDGYCAEQACAPLVDADLLAPLLLNVNRIGISTYEALQRARPLLQQVLAGIPADRSLRDADDQELQELGSLFAVLDSSGIRGARMTLLSKLLHRKRPGFIPLYDEQVRRVYQEGAERSTSPSPRAPVERICSAVRRGGTSGPAPRVRLLGVDRQTRAGSGHHAAAGSRHRRLVGRSG